MARLKHNIQEYVTLLSQEIIEQNSDLNSIVLIGIVTRGYPLAKRLSALIKAKTKIEIPLGKLDITLYRDDLEQQNSLLKLNETIMKEDIKNKTIILVDDVIYHGRTARAAMDNLMDYGRPSKIRLCVLVDRGHREFPICPDYTGIKLDTKADDIIKVHLEEIDKKDEIIINE